MTDRSWELAELAFGALIANEEVQLITDEGDLHIAGDDWTLVLEGDPVTGVLIALDDEDGSPEIALREAMSEEAFEAMRDLNGRMAGRLTSLLVASPDALAHALAGLLDS